MKPFAIDAPAACCTRNHPIIWQGARVEKSRDDVVSKTARDTDRTDPAFPDEGLVRDVLAALSPGLIVDERQVIARIGRPSRLLATIRPPVARAELPDWLGQLIAAAIDSGEAVTVSDEGGRVSANATAIPRSTSGGPPGAAARWLVTFPGIEDSDDSMASWHQRFWNTHPVEPIVNASPFLVCYVDRNFVFRYANEAYIRYWGRTRDQILNHHASDVVPKWHLEKFIPLLQRVLGGETIEQEIRSDVTGATRYFRSTYSPDVAPDGTVIGIFMFSVEITELKEQQTQFQRIIQNVPACFLHVDRELVVRNATQGRVEFPDDELAMAEGRSLRQIWGDELFDQIQPVLASALEGQVGSYTTYLLRAGQPTTYLLFYVVPEVDLDGRVVGLFNVGFDVTPVRQMEREIQVVRERLDRAVRGSLLGVWEIDATRPDWIYAEHLEKLLGLPPGQLTDSLSSFLQHVHDDDRESLSEFFRFSHQTSEPREVEFRVRTADGRWRWMRAMSEPSGAGTPGNSRVAGTMMDIDQLKQAQSALEDQVRQRDMFLAMLAHELRNPLTAIYHSVYLMRNSEILPDSLRDVFEIIDRQSRQLSRLMDDLLDISRLTRNKLKFKFERVDLAEITRNAGVDMQARIEGNRQTLVIDVDEGPIWIQGDRGRLSQAITNLLDNASKYTPQGGRIRLALQADDRTARVVVADTGQGIDPENQSRIFELFFQPEQPLHRSTGGLGVGLYLVRSIIEHHGGTITASSEGTGKGTTVTFEIPRQGQRPDATKGNENDDQTTIS